DPLDALDVVHLLEEGGEVGRRREVAAIRIDRLPEEGDLLAAGGGQPSDLLDDGVGGMAPFPAAGRRDHAEGAVLLAALHHGDEGFEPIDRLRTGGDLDEGALAGLEDGAA